MAPAIAHFLVGASILLLVAAALAVRYDIDREHALWLIPVGGLWGLAPDIHHVAPVFERQLYTLHNLPWMDLFALHYTLDRPAIRARYNATVFGSIAVFLCSTLIFWCGERIRTHTFVVRTPSQRVGGSLVVGLIAGGYATVPMGVAVSIQTMFADVATLVGRDSVLAGGVLVVSLGIALGPLFGVALEAVASLLSVDRPWQAAAVGCGGGIVTWVGAVAVFWVHSSLSAGFYLGALGSLVIYGVVFGAVWSLSREVVVHVEETV